MSIKKEKLFGTKQPQEFSPLENYPVSSSAYLASDEYVSSSFSSACRGPVITRFFNGGKKIVQTVALTAMLAQNFAPYAHGAFTSNVNSGMTVTGELVSSGRQNINSGGLAISGYLTDQGFQAIYDGGVASGMLVSKNSLNAGAQQIVSSGGLAKDTHLGVFGTQTIYNSGVALGTIIEGSGYQFVASGGTSIDTTVLSSGNQVVSSGGTASGTILNSGGNQVVNSGGIAYSTIMSNGGLLVSNGGSAIDVNHIDGAIYGFDLGASGVSLETKITGTNQSGSFYVSNGVASNLFINSTVNISSGGTAYDTTVNSGGSLNISAGGSAIDVKHNVNGAVNVGQTGAAGGFGAVGIAGALLETKVTGTNQYGSFYMSSGVASNLIIDRGFTIYSGGVLSDAHFLIADGSMRINYGGSAINITAPSAVILSTYIDSETKITGINYMPGAYASNGIVMNFVLAPSDWQHLASGVIASNTVISAAFVGSYLSRGTQRVSSGAAAYETYIIGGAQTVYSGGSAIGTTITGGSSGFDDFFGSIFDFGVQYIHTGAYASNTTLSNGKQYLYPGGIAYNTVLNDGGYLDVDPEASAIGVVQYGGNMVTYVGAYSGTYYRPGDYGSLSVDGDLGATKVTGLNGATSFSLENGVASNFQIYGGGAQHVYDGGVAYNNRVINGFFNIFSGGTAISTVLINNTDSYNGMSVHGGGVASNTVVHSNGVMVIDGSVYAGGVSSAASVYSTVINNGGSVHILPGNSVVGTIINSGGYLRLVTGASLLSTTINSGASMQINNGTFFTSTTINSGVLQTVTSALTIVSTTINNLAMQTIQSGASTEGTTINSGGTQVVSGIVSNTTITGGTQIISSGATATDTTVGSGGITNILLGGSSIDVTQAVGGGIGHSIVAGDTAKITGINASGNSFYLSNGVASNFILYSGASQEVGIGGSAINTQVNSGGEMRIVAGSIIEGQTEINEGGKLVGRLTAMASSAELNISSGMWEQAGGSIVEKLKMDSGNIDIRAASAGKTLTINNFTAANNPIIDMNVALGDDASAADKINVTNYTGNTLLRVHNAGGTGALTTSDGIKLVDIQDASTGTFALVGGKVDNGGYEYKLYQGGLDGSPELFDYFLRSEINPQYTNVFKIMANIPIINVALAKTGMNSLEKRLGDLRAFEGGNNGIWLRTYGKQLSVNDLIGTDLTLFGVEAGYDYLFNLSALNKLYVGIMAGYIQSGDIKTKQDNGVYAKGTGNAPSAGIYVSFVNEKGWFVDVTVRDFLTKLDMTNYAADGTELTFKPERNILGASIELGKTFKQKTGERSYVRIEPKAELTYLKATGGAAEVKNGIGSLNYDDADYITGKAGILLGYVKVRTNGLTVEPYIELSYSNEFSGKGKINYAAAEYASDLGGGSFEGAAGIDVGISNNLYIYGQATYEKGDKEEGIGGNLGIRYSFGETAKTGNNVSENTEYDAAAYLLGEDFKSIEGGKPVDLEQEEGVPLKTYSGYIEQIKKVLADSAKKEEYSEDAYDSIGGLTAPKANLLEAIKAYEKETITPIQEYELRTQVERKIDYDSQQVNFKANSVSPYAAAETAGVADSAPVEEVKAAQTLWKEKGAGSPYFKKWFRDSKVVDKNGKPLLVYQLEKNNSSALNENQEGAAQDDQLYFTPRRAEADIYSDGSDGNDGYIMPVFVNIKKPIIINSKESQINAEKILNSEEKNNYNGVIAYGKDGAIATVAAFKEAQVKSVENSGEFGEIAQTLAEPVYIGSPEVEVNMKTVHFAFDKSELSDNAKEALKENAKWLLKNPEVNIVVEGHADERGSKEYNIALGHRRAATVKEYYINLGVAENRITTVSYGKRKPLNAGSYESAYSQNRRSESKKLEKAK
ncbi:peptidoglycan-associated lipoprotein Pal [Endomicrobium proavitum]|uniref:Uncharacterized protein n=1 Tax=Endomicrobium proavitum TaxID=1408281 RepID=A0A0G3WJL8_9BACT|nr:peptidoglycan-associated lipoprotein Pal [Endomicrobium proavitum]AKL98075.1 hypothetical protein Epro_0696 [Endomicrobium proavitum]